MFWVFEYLGNLRYSELNCVIGFDTIVSIFSYHVSLFVANKGI